MSDESEADPADDADAAESETAETDAADAAAEEAGDGEDEQAPADEGLQSGDFVRIDYTARTVEGGDLVDTTDPAVADEEGVETDQEIEPRTIVLGEGHIFESVEEAILGGEVGDEGTVVVPAAEAFGEYDDEQVRTVSADKIPEDDRYPGAQVQIDGEQGRVETIVGGRARVNYNHPLAGEDIEYEWAVLEEVTDRQTQAEGLLDMLLGIDLEVWFETDTVEEERVVEADDEADEADEEDEDAEADDEADAEGDDETDDDTGEDAEEPSEDEEEPAEPETEIVEVEKDSLYIDADPQLTMNQQWMMGKQQIGQQLIDLLGVDRVVVQEVIEGMGGMGMPGMMGMGGGGGADLEAALEEADVDADELAEDLGEAVDE